jgi:hypothetical protein
MEFVEGLNKINSFFNPYTLNLMRYLNQSMTYLV